MENMNLNQEILNQISQMRIDIEFIKEKLEDDFEEVELTDWAKKELDEARKIPDSEMISLEDIEKNILSK